MAAICQGCLHHSMRQLLLRKGPTTFPVACRPFQFFREHGRTSRRFLSLSPSLRFAVKKRTAKAPNTSHAAAAPKTQAPQTQSFAESLALRASPTVLYQAPPYAAYILGSYSFGFFCFSYAGWNFYQHYLFPPAGLQPWVPIAFGVVCIFMSGFGTWLVLGPSRIIRSITALPITRSTPTPAGASSVPPTLNLQVELLPLLPFITRPRHVTLPSSSLTLSNRLYQPHGATAQPYISRRDAVIGREAERAYERSHIMTAPFRHFSQAFFRVFLGLRRVWTREGFTKVTMQGRSGTWKLDGSGGWALDEGRGLDRLVKVRNI